jgi:lipopolysaccharide biosynthesis glycosyltransferase
MLCQTGWALFTDCDVVFMCDPAEIMAYADKSKAVVVVKHHHVGSGVKMGGMVQTDYSRKNWSSVLLFNCDHPANRRLTVNDVNERPGRDLHALYWLNDCEIGEMPAEWNWLVNVQPKPENPKVAHFTNGGPWIDGWTPQPHDDLWLEAAR